MPADIKPPPSKGKAGGIRRRLFISLASFTLLICLSYTGITAVIAWVAEDMVLESVLEHEAKQLMLSHQKSGAWEKPRPSYMQLFPNVAALPPAIRKELHAARLARTKKQEIFGAADTHFHLRLLGASIHDPILVAEVHDFLAVTRLAQSKWHWMVFVAFFMLAIALLLAYFLARQIALPLQVLAREVSARETRRSNPEHPARTASPFAACERQDEIGFLARTCVFRPNVTGHFGPS